MELSKILKKLMREQGVSVAKITKATKVPSKTIYNWLAGSEPKSFLQVKKVADYFDVSLDFLCFGIEQAKSVATQTKGPLDKYSDEINAGVFEVVLRRVKRN